METSTDHSPPEIAKAAAERVLSAAFGRVRLDAGTPLDINDSSDRSNLSRFQVLDGASDVPASVIVKQAVVMGDESYEPDRSGGPASRLFNEWASLRFLGEVVPDRPVATATPGSSSWRISARWPEGSLTFCLATIPSPRKRTSPSMRRRLGG